MDHLDHLDQTNQTNQTDQTDRLGRTDKMDQTRQSSQTPNRQLGQTPKASSQIASLLEIGLSRTAAELYVGLLDSHAQRSTATYLNEQLQLPATSLYRGLRELIDKGFATKRRYYAAAIYIAAPITEALVSYSEYQYHCVRELVEAQLTAQAAADAEMTNAEAANQATDSATDSTGTD